MKILRTASQGSNFTDSYKKKSVFELLLWHSNCNQEKRPCAKEAIYHSYIQCFQMKVKTQS